MRKCIRTRFLPLHTLKNIFFKNFILVVWKYAQIRKNTFLTRSDVKKYLFKEFGSGGQEVCANDQNRFLTSSA
jgi:hypothetical protein